MEPVIPPAPVLRPRADVFSRRLAGGAVLVDLRGNHIFELNDTAAAIWDLLVSGSPFEVIAQRLSGEYEIEASQAAADVRLLLDRLQSDGLIES